MSILILVCICFLTVPSEKAMAQNEAIGLLIQKYNDYQESFASIEKVEDIEGSGFVEIENQSFPVLLESFGEEEVMFRSLMHEEYHRLAVLVTDSGGNVLYKTDQLETNYRYLDQLEQPTPSK